MCVAGRCAKLAALASVVRGRLLCGIAWRGVPRRTALESVPLASVKLRRRTAEPATVKLVLGSCDRSSRSHTSMPPSERPMKSTPGRVGLHAPHVSRALGPTPAKGATKSGVATPSFHRLKDQSPTER